MNKKIFIACDTNKISTAKKIINSTRTNKINIGYKFGLEFWNSKNGRSFISKLKNKVIFADLKLLDIPNTCRSAIKSIKDIKNINYLTVHVSGGLEMLKTIKSASGKIKILGVTTLTSLDNKALKQIGYNKNVKQLVLHQAKLAKLAKLNGIICSPHEAKFLKKICKGMEIITPGIRLKGDKAQDQKRITTPKEAFKNGATSIVIGRSITKGFIKKNIQKLINSLN
jgi:orotidine-5'-phosphate decarboxylase